MLLITIECKTTKCLFISTNTIYKESKCKFIHFLSQICKNLNQKN
jgi:hypothetical protein